MKRISLSSLMIVLLWSTILLSFLGTPSCSDDDDNEPTPTSTPTPTITPTATPTHVIEIMPLKIGNKWRYGEREPYCPPIYYDVEVVGTEIIQGIEVFKVEVAYSYTKYYEYLKNHSDGLYYYGNDDEILDIPVIRHKYPTFEGDTWKDDKNFTWTIEIMDFTKEVVAGSFHCLYSTTQDYNYPYYIFNYWAPNVGWICREGNNWTETQLISYEISE